MKGLRRLFGKGGEDRKVEGTGKNVEGERSKVVIERIDPTYAEVTRTDDPLEARGDADSGLGKYPGTRSAWAKGRVIAALKLGATYKHAAAYAGLTTSSLADWIRHDPAMARELYIAEAESVVMALAHVAKAASEGAWQAAAWRLALQDPDSYDRKRQLPGAYAAPAAEHSDLSPEQRRAKIRELALRQGLPLPQWLESGNPPSLPPASTSGST